MAGHMVSDTAIKEFYDYRATALEAAEQLYNENVVKAIKKAKSILEIRCIQRKARENL